MKNWELYKPMMVGYALGLKARAFARVIILYVLTKEKTLGVFKVDDQATDVGSTSRLGKVSEMVMFEEEEGQWFSKAREEEIGVSVQGQQGLEQEWEIWLTDVPETDLVMAIGIWDLVDEGT